MTQEILQPLGKRILVIPLSALDEKPAETGFLVAKPAEESTVLVAGVGTQVEDSIYEGDYAVLRSGATRISLPKDVLADAPENSSIRQAFFVDIENVLCTIHQPKAQEPTTEREPA